MKTCIYVGYKRARLAYRANNGKGTLLRDINTNNLSMPNALIIEKDACLVGDLAFKKLSIDPKAKIVHFDYTELGTGESYYKDSVERPWMAESILALIIRKLLLEVEKVTQKKVSFVQLISPPYYNEKQAQGLHLALSLAGVKNGQVISMKSVLSELKIGQKIGHISSASLIVLQRPLAVMLDMNNNQKHEVMGKPNESIQDIIGEAIVHALPPNVNIPWNHYNLNLLRIFTEEFLADLLQDKPLITNLYFSNWAGEIELSVATMRQKLSPFLKSCFRYIAQMINTSEKSSKHVVIMDEGQEVLFQFLREEFPSHLSHRISFVPLSDITAMTAENDRFKMENGHAHPDAILSEMVCYDIGIEIGTHENKAIDVLIPKGSKIPFLTKKRYFVGGETTDYFDLILVAKKEREIRKIGALSKALFLDQKAISYELELQMKNAAEIEMNLMNLSTGEFREKCITIVEPHIKQAINQKNLLETLVINTLG